MGLRLNSWCVDMGLSYNHLLIWSVICLRCSEHNVFITIALGTGGTETDQTTTDDDDGRVEGVYCVPCSHAQNTMYL